MDVDIRVSTVSCQVFRRGGMECHCTGNCSTIRRAAIDCAESATASIPPSG